TASAPAASLCGHSIVPLVGSASPAMSRSAVDLPQPDGPSSDTNSPARTARSRCASAVTPLAKVLPTLASATTGGPAASIMLLGGRQYRLLDGLRQGDRAKERFRIEVILPGFVDDPQEAMFLGSGVAKRNVDLPFLERRRIPVVIDAHDQLFCLRLCH